MLIKKTTMGNSNPVWEPGYTPDVHCGAPKVTEDYKDDPKGIQAAYRKARKYVNEDPGRRFCTIGPESWLKCWEVDKGYKAKFKRVNDNVTNYKDDPTGIQAAYRKAQKYVDEDPELIFCTIGRRKLDEVLGSR
ncbi:hypothetical protein OS493_033699 [Desmophyllum pertusum]|uniref:Uncharacterized protein n=1 Tax=Desmophyllum pertusum TaxID=174260 RepID=A0A9W9ZKY8_9CNID|nr:hypothetical protein OS493_033699 [Desmophyllum pertusum]